MEPSPRQGSVRALEIISLISHSKFPDVLQNNTESTKSTTAPTNGLTRSRRSHFSHADTKLDSSEENATRLKSNVHISYESERLKLMAKFHHSRQFPHDWLKICELYPNIVRNKVRDNDDKNNNDFNQNYVTNNNHNKFSKSNSVNSSVNRRSVSVSQ